MYRVLLKLQVHPVCWIRSKIKNDDYFKPYKSILHDKKKIQTNYKLFGYSKIILGPNPPDWEKSKISNIKIKDNSKPWFKIQDFTEDIGDIKTFWEVSRLHWAVFFAHNATFGDKNAIGNLNAWLKNWVERNPPYLGVNWKCGQETAFRVLSIAITAYKLEQIDDICFSLKSFLISHLKRIDLTTHYANAQQNNHITTEAAALYIGGSWLSENKINEGKRWKKKGMKLLEKKIAHLIGETGCFSQYSTNYHRLFMDTISLIELWRLRLNLENFSTNYYNRCKKSVLWLYNFTCDKSGNSPNIGANDGAFLFQFPGINYRDFRPSLELASNLFFKQYCYSGQNSNLLLHFFNLKKKKSKLKKNSQFLDLNGGFVKFESKNILFFMKTPKFFFRPSQSDSNHIDLWVGGKNIFRDAGSYSYNTETHLFSYFNSPKGHNTIEFDNREQMPRLGRFLYGEWLNGEIKLIKNKNSIFSICSSYTDYQNSFHKRCVDINSNKVVVTDKISGNFKKAILRWRLYPYEWILEKNQLYFQNHVISIQSSNLANIELKLTKGWDSTQYLKKFIIPVFQLKICENCEIKTIYQYK